MTSFLAMNVAVIYAVVVVLFVSRYQYGAALTCDQCEVVEQVSRLNCSSGKCDGKDCRLEVRKSENGRFHLKKECFEADDLAKEGLEGGRDGCKRSASERSFFCLCRSSDRCVPPEFNMFLQELSANKTALAKPMDAGPGWVARDQGFVMETINVTRDQGDWPKTPGDPESPVDRMHGDEPLRTGDEQWPRNTGETVKPGRPGTTESQTDYREGNNAVCLSASLGAVVLLLVVQTGIFTT